MPTLLVTIQNDTNQKHESAQTPILPLAGRGFNVLSTHLSTMRLVISVCHGHG